MKYLVILLCFITSCTNTKSHTMNTKPSSETTQLAKGANDFLILGGGCFWCTEAIYLEIKGVIKVESGYCGGHMKNPSYKDICNGNTGHAEVIRIHFDSNQISKKNLLAIFWHIHDPTTLNRQGNDVGTQYRSVVFYANEAEKKLALESKKEAEDEKIWPNPIVTSIEPLSTFYIAEAYHQNYYNTNPNQGYCVYVISPKVEKFRKAYKEQLKDRN